MGILNSLVPCENWHLSPYLHLPVSVNGRHNSVLYRVTHTCGVGIVFIVDILIGWCCCTRSVIGTRGDDREDVDDPDDE
jgi:hypothetical protein